MVDSKGKTILVVDDNYDVRRLERKVLLLAGYNVVEAHIGDSARQMMGKRVLDVCPRDIGLQAWLNGTEPPSLSKLKRGSQHVR